MSTVYTYQVGSIIWNYTLDVNNNATIGTVVSSEGNATTLGNDIDGAITIPSIVNGYNVTGIGRYSFKNCVNITSVTIPVLVTSIGSNAFDNCDGLTFITIPDLVTSIGNTAFGGCTYLTSITIGKSVKTIGFSAFESCRDLASITIPDSVTSIGNNAFRFCSNLVSVTMSNNVTALSSSLFSYCERLTSINIPNSITSIESNVFSFTSADLTVTMNTQTISFKTYTSPTTTDIDFFGNSSVKLVLPPLTMKITASNIDNNATTNISPIYLTFTSSASTNTFEFNDIVVDKGTLTDFLPSSTTVYTATFTPTSQGVCTINVPATKFTDAASQNNAASNIFTFTFDNAKPTMEIAATASGSNFANNGTTKNASIELTFTSNKATNNFEYAGISVTGGTLSYPLTTISPTVYKATFTPINQGVCRINVAANKFTDTAGNYNTAATEFAFTFDSVLPNMTITAKASGSNLANNGTTKYTSIELTFTSDEATNNFAKENIRVSNGTITTLTTTDNKVYKATFTRDPLFLQCLCTINVDAGAYTDAAGNGNNAATEFAFTFDSIRPTIDIESTPIALGSTTKNTSTELTFTLSKVPTGFEYADISVTGGTLSYPLTTISPTVYKATFTSISQGVCSISVPANKFTDAAGNGNTASNNSTPFTFTFDSVQPNMTIAAKANGSTLANNGTTKNASIELTFTSNEAITGFEYADIIFTGGTLSPLAGGGSVYTATFTPDVNGASGKTECSISVPADKFIDAAGNSNFAATTFAFTYDNVRPEMTIAATSSGSNIASGSTTKNKPIELTFTSSEAITGFEYADIIFTGGTLSPLAGGGSVYTATFTPDGNGASGKTECSISVPADKFIDAAGNGNFASNTFAFTYDSVRPDMTITATASGSNLASGSTTKNTPIALTFTSNEAITGFEYADIIFTGGTLSPLAGGGSVYTAIFTPNGNGVSGKTECSISIPADKFIDAAGNGNFASNTFAFTYDSVRPDMTITATASGSNLASGSTTKNTPIALTFTASEAITGFEYADIIFTGGTLSPLAGGGSVYTAIFTPNGNGASGKTECSISVPADKFIDAAGNGNFASNIFAFTYDSVRPGMIIIATVSGSNLASGSTTKNTPIALTFTSSEAITGFEYADIIFTGGTLSPLAGGGSVYTATFTPNGNGVSGKTECSISVPADKFIDSAGNGNFATPFTFTFDSVSPNMTIEATAGPSNLPLANGATTNHTSILLKFTSNEATTNLIKENIRVAGGELGILTTTDNKVYYATFTRNNTITQGQCTINVDAGAYTDAAGNNNNAATAFIWNFETISPNMTIAATAGPSNVPLANNKTTNNAFIELTFTSNEATTNFANEKIRVSNGELSPLTTTDNKVYYATFTRNNTIAQGQCTINVDAGAYTDAAGNYNTAATTFIWNFETISPNVTIAATAGPSNLPLANNKTTNDTSILLTFTSNEETTNLIKENIRVTGGTLTPLTTTDNKVYYATFTRNNTITQGQCTINVDAGAYTDAAGNYNTAATTFIWNFETSSPNMTIAATAGPSNLPLANNKTTNDTSILLTFTSNEETTNFANDKIRVSNGELTPLTTTDNKVYYATFTRNNTITQGQCTIDVDAGAYTDAAGNNNNAATTFIWNFETSSPNMTIAATAGASNVAIAINGTTKNTSIELTFTSSEATNNFKVGGISVTGGTLTPLTTTDNTVYKATFTPISQGVCSINVPAGAFTDAAGNYNTASNNSIPFTFIFDSVLPTMEIKSTTDGSAFVSGSTTYISPIELTFTSSEATNNFEVGGIDVTGGKLINFAGSDTDYTATFTPTGAGLCTIGVAGGSYTDAAGNSNAAATTFTFTFVRIVSFDANTLTIANSIDANATDLVSFVLPAGEEMSNINVAAFTGTGTITYDLSTDGESVSSGTFTGTGTNLLGTNVLFASTNTIYKLTLAANDSIAYTIVGTKLVNYGNVIPTALSFLDDRLTIQNSIVSTDVDKVSFGLTAGSRFYSLDVTSLLNTNSISYVLEILGGSTVSSGSFTQVGVNLLNGHVLEPDTNTTYILTLTCGDTNTYSIVGMAENKSKSAIDKYCERKTATCNNIGYNKLVTSTNNPSTSNKMRYSQLLRTQRFKTVRTYNVSVPPVKNELPIYLFPTGQIFTR